MAAKKTRPNSISRLSFSTSRVPCLCFSCAAEHEGRALLASGRLTRCIQYRRNDMMRKKEPSFFFRFFARFLLRRKVKGDSAFLLDSTSRLSLTFFFSFFVYPLSLSRHAPLLLVA